MEDRYLFRAKHVHILKRNKHLDGIWVEGYLSIEDYINSPKLEGEFLIDKSTICQCTGKLDNTRTKEFPEGKLIFEHDIVEFLDTYSTESGYAEQDCIGEVLWDDEELCFYVTERLSAESYEVLDDCKIIGNRFDNPELLEV